MIRLPPRRPPRGMGLRPPLRGSPWGAAAPAAAPPCGAAAPHPEGRGPGPAALLLGPGRTRPARGCAHACPEPSSVCAPGPAWRRALFAHSASPAAPGPLPLRGSAPARRARRRFAAPVRRLAPSLASLGRRGRPPGPAPRLLRSGRVRRFAAPWPLAGPATLRRGIRCAAGSRRCALVALAPLRLALALRGFPAGSPLGPSACAASGAVGSWPRGLRGPLGPLVSAFGPGAFGCAPAPARACGALSGGAVIVAGFSPASPPPLRPPLGACGERETSGLGGSRPRPFGPPLCSPAASVSGSPLSHCPQRVKASLRRCCARSVAFRADAVLAPALTRCGVSCPARLTFRAGYGTFVWRGPFRSFGGCPSPVFRGYPWTAENRSSRNAWAVFLCLRCLYLLRPFRGSDWPCCKLGLPTPDGPRAAIFKKIPPVHNSAFVNSFPADFPSAKKARASPRLSYAHRDDVILEHSHRLRAAIYCKPRPTQQNLCYFVAFTGSH